LEADCQEFIETVAVLLATLGAPVLESVKPGPLQSSEHIGRADEPERLFFREAGCDASGYQTSEGLVVLAGSKGRPGLRPSAPTGIGGQRDTLQTEGVIKMSEQELVFLRDHLFGSPSAAGGVLIGGTNNGRTSWRNANGQSINDLEQLALASSTSEAHSG
jgi:hypothetical protein